MEQEHRITYKAGITRTPSDFLCQDGELAECINLATDHEELKPIVQPAPFITSAQRPDPEHVGQMMEMSIPSLMYIHKFSDQVRYIAHASFTSFIEQIIWGTVDNGVFTMGGFINHNSQPVTYVSGDKFTSVGRVLIQSNPDWGMNYYTWKENRYVEAKVNITEPDIEFKMAELDDTNDWNNIARVYQDDIGSYISRNGDDWWHMKIYDQKGYNDLSVGLFAEAREEVTKKKAFSMPFMLCYALEMLDGTYAYVSNPIMMMPSSTMALLGSIGIDEPVGRRYSDPDLYTEPISCDFLNVRLLMSQLMFKANYDLSEWSDVVKGVAVFVSREVNLYDTTGDQQIKHIEYNNPNKDRRAGRADDVIEDPEPMPDHLENPWADRIRDTYDKQYVFRKFGDDEEKYGGWFFVPIKERSQSDVKKELEDTRTFYKLFTLEITKNTNNNWAKASDYFEYVTLKNIETQTRLNVVDYYSRSRLTPDFTYVYNGRLNLASVRRSIFGGFERFMPYEIDNSHYYRVYIDIETEDGSRVVRKDYQSVDIQGLWFYYPDPRAKWVTLYKDQVCILNAALKESKGTNGAYYFHKMPDGNNDEPTAVGTPRHAYESDFNMRDEALPDYLIQSEVYNPWVFQAEGYNKVGIGKILGMSTVTMALSQDQFGKTDLIVFSESGIWGMQVDKTGLYDNVHSATRDVCINPKNITQTDNAVFFVSKKGLMVITESGVRCVSELMNGRVFDTSALPSLAADTEWEGIVGKCQDTHTFLDYIRDERCFMAYDYIDSRLIIHNRGYGYSYIFSMTDGSFSKTILPAAMERAINNYPDYLLQGSIWDEEQQEWINENYVYSFYGKPREEEVADRSLAFLLTRPMKLSGPVSQTSLRQLINVGTWKKRDMQGNELSCVKTEVYVSEDQNRWYADISRHGAAARYYRLALYIKMLPTERLSGTILTEQERRSHNFR